MTTEQRLREALAALEAYASGQICMHEDTHRGGTLWEICNQCGAKWADDEGGKPKFKWPKEIVTAREALSLPSQRLREALEEAERFIRVLDTRHPNEGCDEAADAIREALSLPAQEAQPVAWVRFCSDGLTEGPILDSDSRMDSVRKTSGAWTPLYAAPTAQEGYVRVPVEPTTELLRPFYECPPDGLRLAWDVMVRLAQRQYDRAMLAAAQEVSK